MSDTADPQTLEPETAPDDLDAYAKFQLAGWERVARDYDRAWGELTRQLAPHLLAATGVRQGTDLLDVCCGPGYVTRRARELGASAVGIDFSAEMIAIARLRNPMLPFSVGDAQRLDFEAGRFEVVVNNFGVPSFAHPGNSFAEAKRVLRPGGRFAFTVWADPSRSRGTRIVREALEAHADMGVAVPAPPASQRAGAGDYRRLLAQAGFDVASFAQRTVDVTWSVPTTSFLFECELRTSVRLSALLAAQTPSALARIRGQIEREVAVFQGAKGFEIPYAAQVVSVVSP